jgi:hypothetical protein
LHHEVRTTVAGAAYLVRHAATLVSEGRKMTPSTNAKGPSPSTVTGPFDDTTNDLNFATGTRHSKAEATQIAELAVRGHEVHLLRDGGYLVSKYGHTHHAVDFAALQAFARRLGVSQ